MDSLPVELLEKIFRELDWNTLERIEPTCRRWSSIIALRFFQPRLAAQTASVRRRLRSYGWRPGDDDNLPPDLVKQLYMKVFHELPRRWRGGADDDSRPALSPEVTLGEYE